MDDDVAFVYTSAADPRQCPVCARVLNAATGVSLDPAETHPTLTVDAVTVCAYCGTILVVTTLGFRPATDADLAPLDPRERALLFAFSREHERGHA